MRKTRVKKEVAPTNISQARARDDLRESLRGMNTGYARKSISGGDSLLKEQVNQDPFDQLYSENNLLLPPYNFKSLYTCYEESDVLQSAVEAMQQNVDGFGYELQFQGDDLTEKDTPSAKAEFTTLSNFFDHANDEQSMMTIRKLAREDYEVIGNAGLEVIRNLKGDIGVMYHLPFRRIRIVALRPGSEDGVIVDTLIMRNGKLIKIKVRKAFRRFVQISVSGQKLRWFKSFGDKRTMDATDGKFKPRAQIKRVATELLHLKHAFGDEIYGLPRWIGAILDNLGRNSARFINYDLFESQGIPPMAVMVSNGVLTDTSVREIEAMVRSMRGAENWNRVMLLESNVESQGLEDKGTAKIELKSLQEFRKEDQMFDKYLNYTAKVIRHRFRLPPLYLGETETFTLATSKAAKTIAEEQVFIPERETFDEIVNSKLVFQEFGITQWKYKTKGPRIVGAEEISAGVTAFAEAGAFSVNHAIDMANQAFGLAMSKYKGKWAQYPIDFIVKLIESGLMPEGMEDVVGSQKLPAQITAPKPAPGPQQLKLPVPIAKKGLPAYIPQKIANSDLFTAEEKDMYKKLLMIQGVLESTRCDNLEEEDATL